MRRFFLLAAFVLAFVFSASPAHARVSAGELLQPILTELDVRLAALAGATSADDLELQAQITALRIALASDLSGVTDEQALTAIKKSAGKLKKAFPGDATWPGILKNVLDGFAAVISGQRDALNTRIDALSDAALAAKARKGVSKLEGLLATAGGQLTDAKARSKTLGLALKRAGLVADILGKCPGHPGEFGHGQVVAMLGGTELFKPKFATGELLKSAGGQLLSIHIDGFHYPYEKGTIALDFTAPAAGSSYSFAQTNLNGNYQKDNLYFFIESGTATIDEFDPVARRIVAHFEFTGREIGTSATVTVSAGTLTVCEFKVTTQQ